MNVRKKLALLAGLATVAVVGLIGVATSPALAYDPLDPVDTGCINTAYIASSAPVVAQDGTTLGYVENWYSRGCVTNWSRVWVSGGSIQRLAVEACRLDGGGCSPVYYRTDSAAYGDMVDGHHTVRAYGWITVGAGTTHELDGFGYADA